jgi:hypothetical protein
MSRSLFTGEPVPSRISEASSRPVNRARRFEGTSASFVVGHGPEPVKELSAVWQRQQWPFSIATGRDVQADHPDVVV